MEKETFIYEVTDTIKEYGKEEELMEYINDIIVNCTDNQMISETKLNDILWFDSDDIYEYLGIQQDEE